MKNNGVRIICIILAISMICFSLFLFLRPAVNELVQKAHAENEICDFFTVYWGGDVPLFLSEPDFKPKDSELFNPMSSEIFPELYLAMKQYNESIYKNGQKGISDPWAYQKSTMDLEKFNLVDKPIGVLTIPKLKLQQPIYIGATSEHLENGVAQLAISSMPIGGIHTNCVLAGHRGWRGAAYLRYIDEVEIGDDIYVTNFWETMIYRVIDIRIIKPYEADNILIQPGKDLVTLMTCHPYGSGGKYRYLVFCERVQPVRK